MNEVFDRLRDIVQADVGNRGLATVTGDNLLTACPDDLRLACESIAKAEKPSVAVVTGFWIPKSEPPAGETDGPLGALFLAKALTAAGVRVVVVSDAFCEKAHNTGLGHLRIKKKAPIVTLPGYEDAVAMGPDGYWEHFIKKAGPITHLLAIERVGPSHTLGSIQGQVGWMSPASLFADFLDEVPETDRDRYHTMRGFDITESMSPAHWLFEAAGRDGIETIGIGDGGNEIGMGKIPWSVIRANIPNGAKVACRTATNRLIVAGVSNWGAYALAAGVMKLRGKFDAKVFSGDKEKKLLEKMVAAGPLVDGVLGKPSVSVDGLSWDAYTAPLREMAKLSGRK